LQATSLKQKANEEIKRGSRCRLHKHTPYGPAVQSLEGSHFAGREKVGPLLPLLEGVRCGSTGPSGVITRCKKCCGRTVPKPRNGRFHVE
jgi:hypothetical protein